MKTSEKLLIFALVIGIGILIWITRSGNQPTSVSASSNQALLAAQATISAQANEIASLRAQLAACQNSTVVTAAPAPVSYAPAIVKKAPTQKQSTSPQVITLVPEQLPLDEDEVNIKDEAISSGDISVDAGKVYTLPSSFYEAGVKGVKLCLRFGGKDNRYWPHIGINDGSMKIDANIEGNGEKGYNFLLPGAVSTMTGDIGITRDLTFFVSANIVDRYMLPSDNGLVEIKAPGTGWVAKPLTRFGDYYIYRVSQ